MVVFTKSNTTWRAESKARRFGTGFIAAIVVGTLHAACAHAQSGQHECSVAPVGGNSSGGGSGVLFETDFSQDAGYSAGGFQLWNDQGRVSPPTGWDGVYAPGGSRISVVSGAGASGGNALKLEWAPGESQPVLRLAKHLSGDTNTGHEELYIRYKVKLPNNFRAGTTPTDIAHWKWGRLWQNTSPANAPAENGWSENRANSGYVVWGTGGSVPYTDWYATWSANSGANMDQGSAGGARYGLDYFVSGSDRLTQDGYFESMADGEWAFDASNNGYLALRQQQRYHTIEFRFKLASSDAAADGVFEMWWDGVKQSEWTRLRNNGGAPARSGIPTTKRGSGFNFLVFFDNMVGWNDGWNSSGADGFILVDDVVISRSRIGHNYSVEGTRTTFD